MTHPHAPAPSETELSSQDPQVLLLASLTRDLTAQEDERLHAWCAENPELQAALTATWLSLGVFADSDEMRLLRQEARDAAGLGPIRQNRPQGQSASNRPWLTGALMAASVLLAIGWGGYSVWSANRMTTFTAPPQGLAHITLSDGTQVTLSAGGQIKSAISHSKRTVELVRGDAFFDVIHDANRPMTVNSRGHEITDLGTVFNISQASDLYRVTLISGAVRVKNTQTGTSSDLKPGQSYVESGRTWQVIGGNADAFAGWAQGHLIFEDASLAEVSTSFSRLTGRRLIFASPELARLHLSGVINLDHVERACQALSATLPVTAKPTDSGDILISARKL